MFFFKAAYALLGTVYVIYYFYHVYHYLKSKDFGSKKYLFLNFLTPILSVTWIVIITIETTVDFFYKGNNANLLIALGCIAYSTLIFQFMIQPAWFKYKYSIPFKFQAGYWEVHIAVLTSDFLKKNRLVENHTTVQANCFDCGRWVIVEEKSFAEVKDKIDNAKPDEFIRIVCTRCYKNTYPWRYKKIEELHNSSLNINSKS